MVLTAQLERIDEIQERRHAVWNTYHERLAEWAATHQVGLPYVPSECAHPAHIYYLMLPSQAVRRDFLAHLRSAGIQATFHYQPLHNAPAGLRQGRTGPGGCPVAERAGDCLIRLPLHAKMTSADAERVCDTITAFAPGR